MPDVPLRSFLSTSLQLPFPCLTLQIEQLSLIFQLCGTPDSTSWPSCTNLPYFKAHKIDRVVKRRLREVFRT